MSSDTPEPGSTDFQLSARDVRRAAADGIITASQAEQLIAWYARHGTRIGASGQPLEPERGLNLVTVAYFFGAALIVGACGWFLGDKWDDLGPVGILLTVGLYATILLAAAHWLLNAGYRNAGGTLLVVAVCLTPLAVHAIEDFIGLYPRSYANTFWGGYYHSRSLCFIAMELSTILVGLLALWYLRFGLLTAPIAVACWFLSMDMVSLVGSLGPMPFDTRARISLVVGVLTCVAGIGADRKQDRRAKLAAEKTGTAVSAQPKEDFGFWLNLFGMAAFWGGLTSMDSSSELGRFVYLLVNVGLVLLAVKIQRTATLIFGAIGVHIYLFHLADVLFRDSILFPFAIAGVGLSLILFTVLAQRFLRKRSLAPPKAAPAKSAPVDENPEDAPPEWLSRKLPPVSQAKE